MDIVDPEFRNVGAQDDDIESFVQCSCKTCQFNIQCGVKYKVQVAVKVVAPNIEKAHEYCFKQKRAQSLFNVMFPKEILNTWIG